MSPVVSYLIPSYNHARYLPVLLDNLRLDMAALTVPAEIIIVDDGSQDDSKEIIAAWEKEYQSQFLIKYFFQENKGLAASLNKMIREAEGQYLRLCASDDVIIVGSTQKLYEPFLQQPPLLAVIGDAHVIDEHGQVTHPSSVRFHGGRPKKLCDPRLIRRELIERWCIAGPSILIKKSHYDAFCYNELSKIDDFDLFLSILEVPNAMLFIQEAVCLYRIHTTNTSKTLNVARRIENIQAFLSIIHKYMMKKTLRQYLYWPQYKTKAKINFLQRQYMQCCVNMSIGLFFKMKNLYRIYK